MTPIPSDSSSARGRETEWKLEIVARDDFLWLRDSPELGARTPPSLQKNHYFDTEAEDLARTRILLRVREEGGRFILTLKAGKEVRPGLFDSLEIEEEMTSEEAGRILLRPAALLERSGPVIEELRRRRGDPRLVAAGTLTNERVQRRPEPTLRLDVDRVVFPDGTESYELELETSDPVGAERWLADLVLRHPLRLEPERLTKMERFLRWKEQQMRTAPTGGRGAP